MLQHHINKVRIGVSCCLHLGSAALHALIRDMQFRADLVTSLKLCLLQLVVPKQVMRWTRSLGISSLPTLLGSFRFTPYGRQCCSQMKGHERLRPAKPSGTPRRGHAPCLLQSRLAMHAELQKESLSWQGQRAVLRTRNHCQCTEALLAERPMHIGVRSRSDVHLAACAKAWHTLSRAASTLGRRCCTCAHTVSTAHGFDILILRSRQTSDIAGSGQRSC